MSSREGRELGAEERRKVAADFGAKLTAARHQKGLSVEEVADQLRLRDWQIRALEDGQIADLIAPIYASGYINSYAQLLGMNREELGELPTECYGEEPDLQSNYPAQGRGKLIAGRLAHKFVYVLITAFIVLPILTWYGRGPLEALLPSAEKSAPEATVIETLARPPAESAKQPDPELAATESEKPRSALASMAPLPDVLGEIARVRDRQSREALGEADFEGESIELPDVPETTVPDDTGSGFVLTLLEESWVEVTDQTGERVLYDLLQPGSDYPLQGSAPFTLLIGNARGAQLSRSEQDIDLAEYTQGNVIRLTTDQISPP